MTYFKILFIYLLLLLLSSLHIHCLETTEPTKDVTQSLNQTLNDPSTINNQINTTLSALNNTSTSLIKDIINNVTLILSDKHKDNDDKKKEKKKKNKKDKKDKKDKKNNKNDADKASNTINPTTTIYTTIYIIATETPTQIYTGTNQPAKQKGQKSDGDQISDPNSPLDNSEDGNDDDDGNDNNNNNNDNDDSDDSDDNDDNSSHNSNNSDDNNNQVNTQAKAGHSASYRRLVVALSVVGSCSGVILFIAAFVFTRRRIIKKKHFPKDLEMVTNPLLPPPPPPHKHVPPPPPSLRQSSYRINVSQHDGDSTLIDFGDPFHDPTEEKFSDSTEHRTEIPVHLNPETYADFRHNQTLSLLSQTTAAEPSAPTEKELNENPFEQQQPEIPLYYPITQTTIYPTECEQNNADMDPTEDNTSHQDQITPLIPEQHTENHSTERDHRQSITSENQESVSDLPPPAYTPSAIPSAPPLYALPTLSRSQMTELRRSPSVNSSRRHSVSSSILSESRPLSLRRGSGSLAFVSSPIS